MNSERTNISRYIRTIFFPIAAVCALALSITIAADMHLSYLVDVTIRKDAEERAQKWAQDLVARIPELSRVVSGQQIGLRDTNKIITSANSNDIFRFKFFSPDGHLLIVSDEPAFIAEGGEEGANAIAREVFSSGTGNVSIHDGTENPNRPDAYVEAYLVARNANGPAIGVIEVYVDVTNLSHAMHQSFHDLSKTLIIGSAIVYLIPSLILIFLNEKVRARDRELLRISRYDPLTQLLNRGAFASQCHELFQARHNDGIGLIAVDLDHFKMVNDNFGHDFGDNLLWHVAQILREAVRAEDIIGRLGGDEFIIVCPCVNQKEILAICERIEIPMALPFSHKGATVRPGLSMGVNLSIPGKCEEQAILEVDLALYHAKAKGRGQTVEYFEALGDTMARRRHVETCMRHALSTQSGFYSDFQPIFHTCGKLVAGFEALLRLRAPEGELISPAEFIPIAEQCGLICQIGRDSLKSALETAKTWPDDLYLSVNLSAIQFKDGKLVEEVAGLLDEAAFDAHRLELEVTEGLLLEDDERVSQQMAGLKKLGASLSLDDFGTGYSSLGYLWKYKFDRIKIDRVFLKGLELHSEKYRKVISTIVLLGKNLDMMITAEGVENEEQLMILQQLGCDHFQGFLLGKPMSPVAVKEILEFEKAELKSA